MIRIEKDLQKRSPVRPGENTDIHTHTPEFSEDILDENNENPEDSITQKIKNDTGKRLREFRHMLGISQEQMAELFPLNTDDYAKIETGKMFPDEVFFYLLKQKYTISLNWLITGIGDMYQKEKPIEDEDDTYPTNADEINEMLMYMGKSPRFMHAIIVFFNEYLVKHKERIEKSLQAEKENQRIKK